MSIDLDVHVASGAITSLANGASSGVLYTVPASTEARIMWLAMDPYTSGVQFLVDDYRAVALGGLTWTSALYSSLSGMDFYLTANQELKFYNASGGAVTFDYYISIMEQSGSGNLLSAVNAVGDTGTLGAGASSSAIYTVPGSTSARILYYVVSIISGATPYLMLNGYQIDSVPSTAKNHSNEFVYLEAGDELKIKNGSGSNAQYHYYFAISEMAA